jgi:hypothetical protein
MSRATNPRWDQETILVAWLAACVSLFSFLFYLRRGDLLLYGDAVAHINIARRVFDSQTPGLLQLGTVWLPLPHLLMIPFLLWDPMWQSGVGGSIPSMLAYVFGVVGIFRLVRGALNNGGAPDLSIRLAACAAALIYAANPNLIYLQSTAMTEPLYLAFFIWAAVHFAEFVSANNGRSLVKCGACLAGACLTRYDGWFLAVVIGIAALVVSLKNLKTSPPLRRSLIKFTLLAAAGPVLWVAYNAIIYRNPLEFANGPYSARAIENRTAVPGMPPHPGAGDLKTAASYFLKAAQLNMTENSRQRWWLALLFIGAAAALLISPRLWRLWLLLTPLPFYMLSVAYSGVPIFIPPWWPFSLYNVRYGIQLLPAFAVFSVLLAYVTMRLVRQPLAKIVLVAAILVFAAFSYSSAWRSAPIDFREAWVNSRSRIALEHELANTLQEFPPNSTMLMYLGEHVGALQRAGIPLRRVVNEGNHRTWKQPVDSDGLWERTLQNPGRYVDFVIACQGDMVAEKVQPQGLVPIAVIRATGQRECTVNVAHRASP